MAKNILPDIAKLLGVEIDEEFTLCLAEQPLVSSNNGVRITKNNIEVKNNLQKNCVWQPLEADSLYSLFNGNFEIVRKPFKPKYDEEYWTYMSIGIKSWQIVWTNWHGSFSDYAKLKLGLCFRTKEEALHARPRCYKELTGREWQGEDNGD